MTRRALEALVAVCADGRDPVLLSLCRTALDGEERAQRRALRRLSEILKLRATARRWGFSNPRWAAPPPPATAGNGR